MARLNIDTGTEGNVATGDTLRTAMTKINNNFIDVYGLVGAPSTGLLTNSTTNGDIKVQPNGTGIVEIDQLQITDAAITPLITNGDITLTANGTGDIVLGAVTIADNKISTNTSNDDLHIAASGTGAVTTASQFTLTGSFKQAIHTFAATDAITEIEHAGRTCLLGEVGGNALVTLTLPDATGSGATYKFIITVVNTSNYVIISPDSSNTIGGIMLYLDEDGTAVTAFPTVAASDTITLNGGTTGGIVGDYLELVDIATDKWHVRGTMRVGAGANPATPFSATV